MMKKTILITVVGLLMLVLAASMVSAGPNPGGMGGMHSFMGQQANLTDTQKQEVAPLLDKMKDLHLQMFAVQKEMIQKQVSFGNMTQAEADQHIARMQERMEQGPGMMGRGHGMKPHGPMCQPPVDTQK